MIARLVVGGLGGLALLRGARWYRAALGAGAFGAGAGAVGAVAQIVAGTSALTHPVVFIGGAVAGLLAWAVASAAHRWGLRLVGAGIGAWAGWMVANSGLGSALWVVPASILAGIAAFPTIYERTLPLSTSLVGASLVCGAFGWDSPWLWGAIAAAGTALQVLASRGDEA